MPRLFVGLSFSPDIISELEPCCAGIEGAYWQREEQIHLTLAFLGNISEVAAEDAVDGLSRVRFKPFPIRLKGVGFFGKPAQPKALWAGVADAAPLTQLHEKINQALLMARLKPEQRKFHPHVTLARFARHPKRSQPRGSAGRRVQRFHEQFSQWCSAHACFTSSPQHVDHFTLFSSHRTNYGPYYQVEEAFPFGGVFRFAKGWNTEDLGLFGE